MKFGQQIPGVGWYLGTVQYCVVLAILLWLPR